MDAKNITKKYSNGEVTVVWKPGLCSHSKICWTGLPTVFDPRVRPWVKPDGATTEDIIAQVDKCPSGALSWFRNNETNAASESPAPGIRIEVTKSGPLLVHGDIVLKDKHGNETVKQKVT